jgi:hypothetical protein
LIADLLTAEWHNSMVNDVQGRDLIISLPQDEEESVKELCEFAEIVPPGYYSHLKNFKNCHIMDIFFKQYLKSKLLSLPFHCVSDLQVDICSCNRRRSIQLPIPPRKGKC